MKYLRDGILTLIAMMFVPMGSLGEELLIPVDAGGVSVSVAEGGAASFSVDSGEADELSRVGEPQIPWKRIPLLLPPATLLSSVSCALVGDTWSPVTDSTFVSPTPFNVEMYDEEGNVTPIVFSKITLVDGCNTAIYEKNSFWPTAADFVDGTSDLRGWKMVTVRVPLARYNPVQKTVEVLGQASLAVEYDLQDTSPVFDPSSAVRVKELVSNYKAMGTQYLSAKESAQSKASTGNNGYVIAVTKAIQASSTNLAAFIAHKQSLGFVVTVIDEDDIGATSSDTGMESAIKFRTWLQANYISLDLKYLLIIANPLIESAECYFPMMNAKGSTDNRTDYFYAELTHDWDDDNDGIWGEWDWGDPRANDCFEVYVGRIPYYGIMTDTDHILQKTMDYENETDQSWRRKAILGNTPMQPVELLAHYQTVDQIKIDVLDSAAIPADRVYNNVSTHCSEEWAQRNRLTPPPKYLHKNFEIASIWATNKYGMYLTNSHGNSAVTSELIGTWHLNVLNDNYPAAVFLAACSTAAPNNSNNLVYSLLRHGGIVTIGGTGASGGGYTDMPNSGACQGMMYRYANGLTQFKSCGEALWRYAKEDSASQNYFNWIRFNLYGDPSVVVYSERPDFTVTPPHRFYGVRYVDSPFQLAKETYTIINDSSSAINWTASKTASWFDFSATSGTIPAYSTGSIELSMNAAVEAFGMGRQMASFTISNTTHGTSIEHEVEFSHEFSQIYRYNEAEVELLSEDTSNDLVWKALDGQEDNYWAGGQLVSEDAVNEFQLNLFREYELMGFSYLPSENAEIGRVADYEFYVSMDGEHWGAPVATGTFLDTADVQDIVFPLVWARHIRFVALSSHDGGPAVMVAELFLNRKLSNRGVRWRNYAGVPGAQVSDLLAYPHYPHAPQVDSVYSSFESDENRYGSGTRYDAYLVPPTTGDYTFWVAADDVAELWLSSDDTTNNLVKMASVDSWTPPRDWDKYSSQQSVSIPLVAGVPYYVEVLHHGGGGGNNLSVAWQGPGISRQVIASPYLSYEWSGTSASTPVLGNASFTVSETAAMRTPVGTVSATDGDAGEFLGYTITEGNDEGHFAINSTSGEISVVTPLDYETTTSYALTVVVSDKSGKNDSAVVNIAVTDVTNDDYFNEPPTISMSDPTIQLTRVSLGNGVRLSVATSDDNLPAGSTLAVVWTMQSGPATATFSSIDSPSTWASFPNEGRYVLRATVSDGEKEDFVEVEVEVGGTLGDVQPIPTSGLLAHYLFDETSGTNAFDQSGNGYTATLDAELWDANGVFGGAVHLDGVNALRIMNAPLLTDPWVVKRTITFWFKADSMTDGVAICLYDSGWGDTGVGIVLDGNSLYFGAASGRYGWSATYLKADHLEPDRWYHVAMVIDGGYAYYANGFRGYLDGVEIASGPCSTVQDTRSVVALGSSSEGTVFYANNPGGNIFDGYFDNLAVYDRVLSATEIAQMGCALSSVVDAGADTVSSSFITLAGSVGVDPYAVGTVSTQWEMVSGPGTVVFGDASLLATTASFDATGEYILCLSAFDGKTTSFDTITITVDGGAVPLSGLVVYYSFDETTGTLVPDLAGLDHSGTLAGGTWQPDSGVWSGALSLNGSSDTIEIATSSAINNMTLNTRTVAVWFRPDTLQGTQMLYEEGGLTRGMNLYLDGNTLHMGAWQDGSSSLVEVNTTGLVAGQWYHAIFSLDTAGDQLLRGYLDGVEFGSVACSLVGSHTGEIGLGFVNDNTVYHSGNLEVESWFGGRLDDFVLYNRLLTSEEIARLFHINSAPVLANAAFSIQENSAAGSVVGTVSATDPDASDVLAYSILSGNDDGKFAIDVLSGEITLVGAIDYETIASYALTVCVSDLVEEDTATVSISIIDEMDDDSDSDGLNDDWEATHFSSTAAQDASGDPDNDGVNNLQEETLGSDPNNATTPGAEYADLRAWWKLDEGTGTQAADSSGNALNASLQGTPTWTVDQGGGAAIGFDVEVDKVVADTAFGGSHDAITITGWMKRNGDQIDYCGVVFMRDANEAAGLNLTDNILRYHWDSSSHWGWDSGLTVSDGQWSFFALVVEPTQATMYMGAGSALQSSVNSTSHAPVAFDTSMVLGDDAGFNGRNYKGELDEVRFYTRALSTSEIDAIYQQSVANQAPTAQDDSFAIAENSTIGSTVGTVSASDPDAGDTLTYSLTDSSFAIDSVSGVITTTTALDYEITTSYGFVVTVTDAGGLSDTATITVNVNNANESPEATDASGTVAEDAAVGTTVATVSASDPDASDMLTYSLSDSSFAIDSVSGVITVSAALDYETTASYSLVVTATDAGGLSDTATVTVGVTNVNESPVATNTSGVVVENAPNGTSVATVSSSDPDAGDSVTYSLSSGSFAIDPASGEITVAGGINYEATSSFNLTVTATDAGGLSDTATVSVTVINVNETPFATDTTGTVAEDAAIGTTVATVTASDIDAGDTLTYSLTDSSFAIDSVSGVITTTATLDYETTTSYSFVVTATDAGGLSDTATVTVNVNDANESPVATDASGTVAEDAAIGTTVATVTASDIDAGDTLTYSLTDSSFAIDSASGVITVSAAIDYETAASHSLVVTVTDAGGISDTATVAVTVTNVNEAPFATDTSGTVAEDATIGTTVATVTASDIDAGDTLTYSLTDSSFAIDSASGVITTTATLDYETATSHSLLVTVTDTAGLTDTATVSVSVTDVPNDDSDADGLVDEWEITHFASITAQDGAGDPDSDGVSNEREETLGSDPNNAATPGAEYVGLRTWWKLDDAAGSVATDSSGNHFDGIVSGATWVTGLDGGALSFDGADDQVLRTLTESSWSQFTVALWVKADVLGQSAYSAVFNNNASSSDFQLDVDGGNPGNYRYHGGVTQVIDPVTTAWTHLTVSCDGTNTKLYKNGALVVTQSSVDNVFGQLALGVNRTGTTFFQGVIDDLRVYDIALDASGVDALYQQNASNQAPTALDDSFVVAENSALGTVAGTVVATDPDTGDTLAFSITAGNTDGKFAIDAATGEITVVGTVDYETTSSFALTVSVTDGEFSDTATVTVGVTDVNETPVATDAFGTVAEDAAIGTTVVTVTASDPDAGDTLSYAITAGNTGDAFAIDSATGEITVAGALDYDSMALYTLTVAVADAGALSDTSTIYIDVTEVLVLSETYLSDLNWVSQTSGWGGDVKKDLSIMGAPIVLDGITYPKGLGTHAQSEIVYDLAGNYLTFHSIVGIDDETGVYGDVIFKVYGDNVLLYETAVISGTGTDTIHLDILGVQTLKLVVDGNGNISSDHADWADAYLGSLNLPPTAQDATLAVAENSTIGSIVGAVSASDPDAGDTLTYSLVDSTFAIDSASGEITTTTVLDYETTTSYSLLVTATDAGGLSDTATITVNVNNVNESPVATDASGIVAEDAAIGTAVATVTASDIDAGDTLTYSLSDSSFAIDSASGEITTTTALDYETTTSYSLVVTATDAGGLSDTATVTVSVTDVVEYAGPPAGDLVVHFSLDQSSGTTVVDAAGGNNNGTLTGGTWNPAGGIHDGALALNGTSDLVALSDSSEINLMTLNNRTIALWFRADALASGTRQMLFEEGGNTKGLNLHLDGAVLRVGAWPGSGFLSSTALQADRWYHVALTLDDAGSKMIGYLDGVQFDERSYTAIGSHNGDIGLGVVQGATKTYAMDKLEDPSYFGGDLDEFVLYNRTLSASEITALSAGGEGQPAPMSEPEDSPYSLWMEQEFAPEEMAVSAVALDPDNDQLPNLLEYALVQDPQEANPVLMGQTMTVAGAEEWVIEFTRDATRTDVDIVLEWSASLTPVDWRTIAESVAGGPVRVLNGATLVSESGDDPTTVQVAVPGGINNGFIQWRVIKRR